MNEINIYIGLAVNGFFTGMGVLIAGVIIEVYVKPLIKKIHKKVKRHKK